MRKVLLASAAVVVGLGVTGFSTDAKADFWGTLNKNFGYVDGDLYLHDFKADDKSSISAGNVGALTVNENEENRDVKIKGPVVKIDVDQDNYVRNDDQGGLNLALGKQENKAGQVAVAAAGALSAGNGNGVVGGSLNGAAAGAAAGNIGFADQENKVIQSDDDYNRQYASNHSFIYVENQLRGLLNCGCSYDDFLTYNVNYGTVSGDVHAGRFELDDGSSLSAGNIGAATINKSVNNLDVNIGTRHIRRR